MGNRVKSEVVHSADFIVNWLPENLITGNDLTRLISLVDNSDERSVVDQVLPSKLRALTKPCLELRTENLSAQDMSFNQ